MGGTWFTVGLILGAFYRRTGVFDSPLLSLGLIFLFADIGVILNTLNARMIRNTQISRLDGF